MGNLTEHARRELELSGVDNDIYGDMLSKAVLELIEVFEKQEHSGMSARYTLRLFTKLANFENLTELTDSQDEWNEVGEHVWQSSRNSEAFSSDGGKTYTLLSEQSAAHRGDIDDIPLHTSKKAGE
jgi:hypothetical protein